MKLTIDNGDGSGALDYTPALLLHEPLTIRRARGQLAVCSGGLDVQSTGLPEPADRARVQVRSNAGTLLFAGYLSRAPLHDAAVMGSSGRWSSVRFQAAEDAWLLQEAPSLVLQPTTSATHAISLAEHAVRLDATAPGTLALRAADVTVSGGREAAAFVTELFQGDSTTASFALMDEPFRPAGSSVLLADSFEDGGLSAAVWSLIDPGGRIGLGSGGLSVTGGNGFDGQTVLCAVQPMETGGTITAELSDLQLQAGSDGVLLGMYSNIVTVPNCFAGFRVKGTAGARTIVAIVNGAEQGTPFTFAEGHSYTMRLRLHCAEMQRVMTNYQALVDGAVESFGPGSTAGSGSALVEAPMQLVFEVVDQGLASNTVATVLYAGAVASSPARCVFALVNSVDLLCQAGACRVTQNGSAWVVGTLTDGTVVPRREGAVETGADFSLSGSTVLFYPGRVPVANEAVTVTYRSGRRSFARLQDADALTAIENQGLPGLSAWAGSVHGPAPRSSADCRSAAAALRAFGASVATGIAGECTLTNPADASDIQPGDRLLLPIRGANPVPIPVEAVVVQDGHCRPEVLTYTVRFAQERQNGLSFTVEDGLAGDVPLPVAVSPPAVLANLPGLQVVSATGAALQVDAGTAPPNGGGFEVRRRDGGFGNNDADLVLQSPVRSFSLPRAGFRERFYVRMYDGSLPPVYSEWSSVVVTHLPVD